MLAIETQVVIRHFVALHAFNELLTHFN